MKLARTFHASTRPGHDHHRNSDGEPTSHFQSWAWIVGGPLLVAAGVGTRLFFRDIPNFSPVAAIALYAGFAFRGSIRAWWIPVAVMGLSDLVVGGYDMKLMLVVYAMLALPVVAGSWLARRSKRWGVPRAMAAGMLASVVGSIAFFLVTNSAVWAFSSWYAKDVTGWFACLSAGLPFFRYTLCGDLVFASVLFGSHAIAVAAWHAATRSEHSRPVAAESTRV